MSIEQFGRRHVSRDDLGLAVGLVVSSGLALLGHLLPWSHLAPASGGGHALFNLVVLAVVLWLAIVSVLDRRIDVANGLTCLAAGLNICITTALMLIPVAEFLGPGAYLTVGASAALSFVSLLGVIK